MLTQTSSTYDADFSFIYLDKIAFTNDNNNDNDDIIIFSLK